MKKIYNVLILLCIVRFQVFSYEIEKLGVTGDLNYFCRMNIVCPSDIFVDEVNSIMYCKTDRGTKQTAVSLENGLAIISSKEYSAKTFSETYIQLSEYSVHFSDIALEIKKENNIIVNCGIKSGISFILKKDNGYIVYYIDKYGYPGAVDTEGKIYTNKEAIAYLKQYDSEKYVQSLERAEELGLKNEFENAEVLVWGKTYYKATQYLLQYDEEGLSYSFACSGKWGTFVGCHLNDEEIISMDNLNDFITLIGKGKDYSTSWYVGFGGNIYYYIAGEEYTEVFRIRRTWGDPDFYAMAINGYTEDEYGKYVDEVLPKLNKTDLRLLRNTVFALYGVHFKSEDLSKHFDKEVWYTDEGKTADEIELPEHRQKLVEMILEIEK